MSELGLSRRRGMIGNTNNFRQPILGTTATQRQYCSPKDLPVTILLTPPCQHKAHIHQRGNLLTPERLRQSDEESAHSWRRAQTLCDALNPSGSETP